MIISWGSYKFPIGQAALFISRTANLNEAKQQVSVDETWRLTGMVLANSRTQLLSNVAQLEAAFAQDNKDLIITLPDGSTTARALRNGSCLGGTRVTTPISYPEGHGSEFVNRRVFDVAITGTIVTPGALNALVSFQETLSFTGNGGPAFGHLEPLNGFPVKQQTRQNTVVRATQAGQAIGFLAYPAAPYPIWPGSVMQDRIRISYTSPKRVGMNAAKAYHDFGVSWSYEFESNVPLFALPNVWQ